MNHTLYLDIETLPDMSEGARERSLAGIEAPANYKDAEKIAAYKQERAEEAYRKTSLNGGRGSVFCIGCAIDDKKELVFRGDSEKQTIEAFFGELDQQSLFKVVGHNVEFDLRFLWQRCWVLGIKPPACFPKPERYSKFIFDTMTEWAGFGNRISCRELCGCLGISYSDEVDGSGVYDAWVSGDHESIVQHCFADVSRVRQIYKRMTFQ